MKKAIANILPFLFIFIMAACNLFGNAATESGSAEPTAVSEPDKKAPTANPESSITAPTAIPEPLATGYTDLLQDKIGSGEWTLEIGLVTLLKLFAGEIQVSQASLGPGVLETEGTGILEMSGNYLRTGTDQTTKDEITRLINLLIPTQETLDRYSIPEQQASGRTLKLAAPAMQTSEQCESLWTNGFPDSRTPSFPCFLFGEQSLSGNAYRVYYPLAWHGDDSRDEYYRATLAAIQDSITLYKTFFPVVKPIYFVFTPLTGQYGSNYWAWTYYYNFRPDTEACPVIIHPGALTNLDIPKFKQLMAHEIFHCFQAWNLGSQLLGPGEDTEWWSEGTAEYFSNLVYPETNFEHRFASSFSRFSTFTPITDMSYENFAFFQFLGNSIGPEGVISMLSSMPTTPGRAAQLAALAAVPGMQDTFELFVRSVLDDSLVDSDEAKIIFPINYIGTFPFTDIASIPFSGQPFVLSRYLVTFASEKSFSIETHLDGQGHAAARPKDLTEAWGSFPAAVTGSCDDLAYILYVITTTPAAAPTETISATTVTQVPCDRCLIGSWEATNDSVASYFQSVYSSGGNNTPKVGSVTGTMFMTFEANGTDSSGYENLMVHETSIGGSDGTEATITFDGFSNGSYSADGSALIGLNGTGEILVTAVIYQNGVSTSSSTIPFRPEDFPVGSGIPTRYSCDGDTLTTWPPVEAITVEPVIWTRTAP